MLEDCTNIESSVDPSSVRDRALDKAPQGGDRGGERAHLPDRKSERSLVLLHLTATDGRYHLNLLLIVLLFFIGRFRSP